MCVCIRHWISTLLLLAVALVPERALAWVETTIVSDTVVLDVQRDGSATVAHELGLRVRGGPLTGVELDGIDLDAEPLPDAVAQPTKTDEVGASVPLLIEKTDDGKLRIEFDHPKGLRSGGYMLRFRYRTRLLDRDLIRAQGERVEVRWVGPRLPDGIDSAKVTFRLPLAKLPPELPNARADRFSEPDDPEGVFLSTLRRGADTDELEVVRPHVAKGEPVVWRVSASAKAFDAFRAPEPPPTEVVSPPPSDKPLDRAAGLLAAAAILLSYSALMLLKWRQFARACAAAGAAPRPLIPLRPTTRAGLAGAALSLALIVALYTEQVSVAGGLLLLCLLLATQRMPEQTTRLRGPGRWLPLSEADVTGAARQSALPGRWLDATQWRGRVVFSLIVLAAGAAVVLLLRRSSYAACLAALGTSSLVPLFWTGTRRELPDTKGPRAAKLLRWLYRKLKHDPALKIVFWGRIPDGAAEPDELRLLVLPRAAVSGLTGIEVCLDHQHGLGGSALRPCVLVRAVDGSAAYHALPHGVVWTRGRKPEERVAVIHPALPARDACIQLIRELTGRLGATRQANSRSKSGGKPSSTLNPGKRAVPDHATQHA